MNNKWLFFFFILAGFLFAGCTSDAVSPPVNLFKPKTDNNASALCTITLKKVDVVTQGTPPKAALTLQGSVGAYCGQLEITMLPLDSEDVRIIVVAETPSTPPTADELKSNKPVFVNMTLDSLPTGRYQLFVNGTKYQVFSTP
jgi:hypothetical protein